eukprot:COSAG03_NODE_26961_length_256_cov_0.630573_1_plen_30_part_10
MGARAAWRGGGWRVYTMWHAHGGALGMAAS